MRKFIDKRRHVPFAASVYPFSLYGRTVRATGRSGQNRNGCRQNLAAGRGNPAFHLLREAAILHRDLLELDGRRRNEVEVVLGEVIPRGGVIRDRAQSRIRRSLWLLREGTDTGGEDQIEKRRKPRRQAASGVELATMDHARFSVLHEISSTGKFQPGALA